MIIPGKVGSAKRSPPFLSVFFTQAGLLIFKYKLELVFLCHVSLLYPGYSVCSIFQKLNGPNSFLINPFSPTWCIYVPYVHSPHGKHVTHMYHRYSFTIKLMVYIRTIEPNFLIYVF